LLCGLLSTRLLLCRSPLRRLALRRAFLLLLRSALIRLARRPIGLVLPLSWLIALFVVALCVSDDRCAEKQGAEKQACNCCTANFYRFHADSYLHPSSTHAHRHPSWLAINTRKPKIQLGLTAHGHMATPRHPRE
jgi:hypothetical protein